MPHSFNGQGWSINLPFGVDSIQFSILDLWLISANNYLEEWFWLDNTEDPTAIGAAFFPPIQPAAPCTYACMPPPACPPKCSATTTFGQLAGEWSVTSPNSHIDVSALPPGSYFISINGHTTQAKVVIQ
ncbi:MAG: T9SS type A sorting domain-containing protein [Saprospiraceae bacterium]